MLYRMHEMSRALLSPWVHGAEAAAKMLTAPGSWMTNLPGSQRLAAGYELFYRLGKDYEKPEFEIRHVEAHGYRLPVVEIEVDHKPFCRLLRFKRYSDQSKVIDALKDDPKVLVVAPLSGHHSTLLRDTVRTLLPDHKVWITDWIDARMVPLSEGAFHLDDYVAYIEDFIRQIGADNLHVISVCQPTVPVLAALALMSARGEAVPRTVTLMGGPIDTRQSPTAVNNLATTKPLSWFRSHVIHEVPRNYPGAGRKVYPGFLQHTGFIAMNPNRHAQSHWDFYQHLIAGDLEDAESHRRFYDEYNAVLDMAAEYYLDTIRIVFQQHLLPKGKWEINGERVDAAAIDRTAILTIEGELDDISGLGQTRAAHGICTSLADADKQHIEVEGAGHYGIFSGRRWREAVYPQVREFIRSRNG
jgi:poly(3-hydroxybutyrate) depolymerase